MLIFEWSVLVDGLYCQHSIACCFEVTHAVLTTVFKKLFEARVVLEGMILKPNRVIDEKDARKAGVEEVAEKTVRVLKQTVPAAVLKNCFSCLAGNQLRKQWRICLPHLFTINALGALPWKLTFS